MKLSKNFSLAEFTKSQAALRLGLDNSPTTLDVESLEILCKNVLQPIRDYFGPVVINSGYRSLDLNKAIGGSPTSQHCHGQAADIECPGHSNYDVAAWISKNLSFDQLILEFYTPGDPSSGWIHVSWKNEEQNRTKINTAVKENGRTVYRAGLLP